MSELFKTIVGNARGLSLGLQMLAIAFVLVFVMNAAGLADRVAWSIALCVVLPLGCVSKILTSKGSPQS